MLSSSAVGSTLTPDDVHALLDVGDAPHVSLFLPTRRPWNQTKKNQLTLNRLLNEAKASLSQHRFADADADQLLRPVADLVDDHAFWQDPSDGLAIFVARSHTSVLPLPFAVPERQFVDHRFHVRPLLHHLQPDGPFYLLALSQGGVTLFRGRRFAIEEVPLPDVPTTLEEALQFDDHIRSVTFHTGSSPGGKGDRGKRAALYHGHEDAGDKAYVKEGILRFLRTLDNAVRNQLDQEPTPPPLVLAGVPTLRGLYRKANHYPHLTETDVDGHYVDWSNDAYDVDALHEQAWGIVEPLYAQERTDAVNRFTQWSGTERASGSLHAVVAAAHVHRIDTLFVDADSAAWGRYRPQTHEVEVHTTPAPSDTELLNATVAWTLDGNGTVHVVDADEVPSRSPAAAIFRF
jgi:hypothetical protein